MKKKDAVYRYIADGFLSGGKEFTQSEISKYLKISLSTVNNAVKQIERISAIRLKTRSFEMIDFEKLMLFWATQRNLDKDVIYSTHLDLPVSEIERSMPNHIKFTAYTAYKSTYKDVPADYSEVYVYVPKDMLPLIKNRFPQADGNKNLFALKPDAALDRQMMEEKTPSVSVSPSQMFVDLWNLKQWYAKDFLAALKGRLKI